MLINLTNHRIEGWPESQVNEAKNRFSNIIDFPFPTIDPNWSKEEIEQLAKRMFEDCITLLPENDENGIHVMGEFNFTFAFVTYAKTKGVKCVSSTTKRDVEITDKGEKLSIFQFVKFREY
jgi:hypothetical protein